MQENNHRLLSVSISDPNVLECIVPHCTGSVCQLLPAERSYSDSVTFRVFLSTSAKPVQKQ